MEESMTKGRKRAWNERVVFATTALLTLSCVLLFSPLVGAQSWQIADPGAGGAFITTQVGPTGFVFVGSDLAGIYHSSNSGGFLIDAGSFNGLNEPDRSRMRV